MTPADLKKEIESGPLAAALAPFWADVFPDEPQPAEEDGPAVARWGRIRHRFGSLTPDAVYGLLQVLNDPNGSSCPRPISVPAFVAFLAGRGLLRRIKAALAAGVLPGPVLDACDLITTIVQSSPEQTIDPEAATTAAMIEALKAGGLAGDEDQAAFVTACMKPCSRLERLGWTVGADDLQAAKGAV